MGIDYNVVVIVLFLDVVSGEELSGTSFGHVLDCGEVFRQIEFVRVEEDVGRNGDHLLDL